LEETELQQYKDSLRKEMLKYTRKAFRMLPDMPFPRILDIGCGSGVPTVELAKLSDGEITAIDIDQPALDRLISKIKKEGLADRIKVKNRSLINMDFPDASFDIIWSEGSIFVVGFEKGLKDWRRFLKTEGFLIVHDELGDLTEKQKKISQCGYELIDHFILSENIWWNEYFLPLDKKLRKMRAKHAYGGNTTAEMDNDQREIDKFKENVERNRSVYFIMRKDEKLISVQGSKISNSTN
jgi:ubiquinone/menaquinone biosynthesis C-methylase UbiE